MKRLAILTALVAFSASVQAASETYVIDNSQTSSEFSYRAMGMSSDKNRFEKIRGKVVLDRAAKTGSADVTIDASSVNTGHAMIDKKLQSKDFFDAANHPEITFKSSKMVIDGDRPNLSGELTIKGVTKQVTLAITYFQCETGTTFNEDTCGANATVTIKRSDFNMNKLAMLVGNDITLNLAIKAVKAQPALQVASR